MQITNMDSVESFPTPITTVDAVMLTLSKGQLSVGLITRDRPPYAGLAALPGGYVHVPDDDTLEAAAARILRDKARVECRFLEQLATFSGAARDPRGWSLTVAYFALVPEAELLAAAGALSLHPVGDLPPLAFDHAAIIAAAVARLRGRSSYSALPAFLLPPLFTLTELHAVYQQVLDTRLDPASFRRKITDQGIVEAAESRRVGAHRPAALFRLRAGQARSFLHRI
jgi:ADP-ribose pyrophosphatase YjhB (NUDIX family)